MCLCPLYVKRIVYIQWYKWAEHPQTDRCALTVHHHGYKPCINRPSYSFSAGLADGNGHVPASYHETGEGRACLCSRTPWPCPGIGLCPAPQSRISVDTRFFQQMGSTKECRQPSDNQPWTKIKANPRSREVSGGIPICPELFFFYHPNTEAAARR